MTATPFKTIDSGMTDRQRILAILSASSSNLMEWFNFYIYAFFSIYFASSFFPSNDPTVQLLQASAIFAMGFLARPLGGWFFGRLADRAGRRKAMVYAMLLMFVGSLLIVVTPTYQSIGWGAPFLLLLARLLQGLSIGGDYGTTAAYMSEVSLKNRRGFFSSFQYVTLVGGQLLAALSVLILQQFLSENQLKAGAWRIPFVIGAVGALFALWLRTSLKEEPSQKITQKKAGTGSLRKIWEHRGAIFTVFGFTAAGTTCFYTFTVYLQKYLVGTAGMPKTTATLIITSALFVFMLMQPVFGALSDRIGRRNSLVIFSVLMMFSVVPIFNELSTTTQVYKIFGLALLGLLILSFYTGISGVVKAELFPTEVRALGVNLSHALANTIFGGSAEYLALKMKASGMEADFYWYITFLCAISLIVSLRMPDLRKKGYLKN